VTLARSRAGEWHIIRAPHDVALAPSPARAGARSCPTVVPVREIDELLANNDAFVMPGHLDARPVRKLAIVTCMDARIDLFSSLGIAAGEAHILRNAGGVITDDVIRSLAISQRRLGTRGVMIIQHTECGMQLITDDEFRAELQEAAGVAPAFAIESFGDLEANIRESILRVRRSPFLMHTDAVRGFVYDVHRHRLREVVVDGSTKPSDV